MPSRSRKQARFMARAASDPAKAKAMGVPQHVAREFHAADKSKARKGKGPLRKGK